MPKEKRTKFRKQKVPSAAESQMNFFYFFSLKFEVGGEVGGGTKNHTPIAKQPAKRAGGGERHLVLTDGRAVLH